MDIYIYIIYIYIFIYLSIYLYLIIYNDCTTSRILVLDFHLAYANPGGVQHSKVWAVSRKSLSSLATTFGKRPVRVKQITLIKLAKLIRPNTWRILRGILWAVGTPAGARTTTSLSSS